MKTLLKKSVCLWLSLAVLLGSVGLTVSEHICLVSGKVILSYEHSKHQGDPCAKQKHEAKATACAKPVLKSKCCAYKLDQHKLETATQVKLTQFSFAWIPTQFTFSPVFSTISQTRQEVLHYTNSSPPLYGKNLLYSLHTLRV